MLLLNIIFVEVIVLLGILIVYWLDYTYAYIHCHCSTVPCPEMTNYEKFKSEFAWFISSKTIDARNIDDEDIKIFNLNDNMVDNEIKKLILDFFEEYPEGKVTLIYPKELELIRENIHGMEITKNTFNRLKFCKYGIYIRQALGFSIVTGKHLFLPYGCFSIVFEEE